MAVDYTRRTFDNYDHLEPIPNVYGLVMIGLSMAFFLTLSSYINKRGRPKNVSLQDHWKWKNLFVSWLHAMIVGVWDILCFVLYPEMTTDLIGYHNMFLYSMVAVSTGYFFYDFLDIILHGKPKSSWEVLLHHVAVSSTFFYNLVTSRCLSYTVVALMAEINSFFLHSRKLMQMLKINFDAPLYRLNVYLNLSTFVVCRFYALAWIVYGMALWHHRVDPLYMVGLSGAIVVMWVINIVLFSRLYHSDIRRPFSAAVKAPKHTADITATAPSQSCTTTSNGYESFSANNNGPLAAKLRLKNGSVELNGHINDSSECVTHNLQNGLKTL